MSSFQKQIVTIPEHAVGQRIDKVLAGLFDEYSRSSIQSWIKKGLVLLDDEQISQKDKVLGGESVEILIPEMRTGEWEAQDIPINIVHEDDDMMVIHKPAGLVVHPGAGNLDGTLLNALLFYYPESRQLARAGIVHRLDKDTSGLMVVAKTEQARLALIEQLADHSLHREYQAIAVGNIISGATVDEPIGRDKHDRRRMCVNMMGKNAVTHYRVEQRFRKHTLLKVNLETGRTHQIRVHMNFLGHPLVGDQVYGKRLAIPKDCHPELEKQLRLFKRQALHAAKIAYRHPVTGEQQSWEAELPEDMQALAEAFETDNEQNLP